MSGWRPDWADQADWPSQAHVKWRHHPPQAEGWPPFFEAEARGLALLAATGTVRVPQVYAHGLATDTRPAFIAMEWIDCRPLGKGDFRWPSAETVEAVTTRGPGPTSVTAEGKVPAPGTVLGRQLAALHRITADAYGLDHNNYCGDTPQDNRPLASWVAFYGQRRLGFQMELAGQRGLMPLQRRRRLERLISELGRWIDESTCRPALLHGDLWSGNWLVDATGSPVLIDPAVYYGDREAELAMCRLFGGFPPEFYRAYDQAWPPAAGRDERIPLYQLYHLLNHLNLFGESYGSQVDLILRRFVD